MSSLYLNSELESATTGSRVGLPPEEAKHAVRVARARLGERVSIGNGRGLIVHGVVVALAPFAVDVDEVTHHPVVSPAVWLVQALAKGDRDELAIQAATELGVSGVTPWAADHSIVKWDGPKAGTGRERWGAIVREASKQSVRAWVPSVAPLSSAADVARIEGVLLVLDPLAAATLSSVPLENGVQITVVVGPEGGISEREFHTFVSAGATRVRLGREILRTSTAGPAAIAVLNARLGRW